MSGDKQDPGRRILVLGVGNVLLRDEGFGVHLVKEMAGQDWPPEVEFIDGGTAGLELIYLLAGVSLLIVVDSLDADMEPGSVFKFKVEDLTCLPAGIKTSFHDIGLLEVLRTARILGWLPETIIFGVQPKTVDWGLELTPELNQVKSKVANLVAREITAALGR